MTDEIRATDFLGNTYGVGDFVCYATIDGKSPVQKFARVEKIEPVNKTRYRFVDGERIPEMYTYFKVGVREIKNGRGFTRFDSYNWDSETKSRIPKQVRVTYPMSENIVAVTPAEGVA